MKLKSIDDFTDTIAMKFPLNNIVEKLLTKINRGRDKTTYDNITISDNRLVCTSKDGFLLDVTVDLDNNRIITHDIGRKKKDEATIYYDTKKVLNFDGNKMIDSTSYDETKHKKEDFFITTYSSGNFRCYYNEEGKVTKSYKEETSHIIKKNDEKEVVDEYDLDTINTKCYLANGDKITKNTINDKTTYSYIYNDGFKDIAKNISTKEYYELSDLEDDPYKVANNDIVYASKKGRV